MYNRYAESARVNFFRNHGRDATEDRGQLWDDLLTPRGLGLILKSIKTEFKFVSGLKLPHVSSSWLIKFL